MKQYRLGVIGYGHMSSAIVRGALKAQYLKPEQLIVFDISPERRSAASEDGIICAETPAAVCADSEFVLLAVRPQNMPDLLNEMNGTKLSCLLSIVTGYAIGDLRPYFPDTPIIRLMPNTPMQVNHGAVFFATEDGSDPAYDTFVEELFSPMGAVKKVHEDLINRSVAVHGSTPAYFYFLVNALINDAVLNGFDADTARDFITETMIGSGELLKQNRSTPVTDFIDEVCSPGGATIEAITLFRERNMEQIIHDGNTVCINRAIELGKHEK